MPDLLQAADISKRYGGIVALDGASFTLRPGEVHALMGENGAGKSTLARVIAGSAHPDSGSLAIDGRPVHIANPLDAQRFGIGIIYQELDLFPNLTAGENIVIGNLRFAEGSFVRPAAIEAFCRPFLDQVGSPCSPRDIVASLSIGQTQLVAIARALSMNARMILMDEPTSALFGDAAQRLFANIRALRQRGVSIVYVSHKMDEIFQICDRVTVLRDGRTIGTREVSDTTPAELIQMMIGREVDTRSRISAASAEPILTIQNLTTRKLRNVSLQLHRGEILGIAGLVGAGRSELGEALMGHPGLALVPEDRKLQGLMPQMTILENTTLASLRRFSRFGFLDPEREDSAARALYGELSLKAPSPHAEVMTLSGGNQQKVLLAKCLLTNPSILFLDDPTRGIDVGAKEDIYRIMENLAARGSGILFVSSELPELLRCSHRIMVMREGEITATFDAASATQQAILAAATRPPGAAA